MSENQAATVEAHVLGYQLPGFQVQPDTVQLFLFSAVTWNPHRIHYDEPYTTGVEGHPGLIVQGPLIGSWVIELASAWVDGWADVHSVSYRNIASAVAGQEMSVSGLVTEGGESPTASIQIVTSDGTIVCEGTAQARRRRQQA